MTQQQQYQLAIQELNLRSRRFLLIAIMVMFIAAVSGAIAAYGLLISPSRVSSGASSRPKSAQDPILNVAEGLDKSIANQRYQNNRFRWVADKPALTFGRGCGLNYTGPVACELVVAPAVPALPLTNAPRSTPSARSTDVCETSSPTIPINAASSPTHQELLEVAHQKLLEVADWIKAFDNYTAALAAVTKAQDRADFDIAADKLSAALGGLAQSAGPYGAAAAPVAKASVNIAFWFIGKALDYQRLEELRIATRAACQPVHVITDALGFILEDQRRVLLSLYFEWLGPDMLRKYNVDRTTPHVGDQTLGTDIDNAQAAVAKFEAARVANPTATMRALRDAHDELVVAVRNNHGEFGALIANLQMLAQDALAVSAATTSPAKKS